MTTISDNETDKKASSFFKFLALFAAFLVIGTLISALVLMFSSLSSFGGDFNLNRLKISTYMLYGVSGSIPLVLMPTVLLWINSKRKALMHNAKKRMRIAGIGPFAANFEHAGVKNARFCEYCGYEVRTGERECPECGGPVRKINI